MLEKLLFSVIGLWAAHRLLMALADEGLCREEPMGDPGSDRDGVVGVSDRAGDDAG